MMGKYTEWKVESIKQELRKRGARLSGRKTELIERLEAYDRNSNFQGKDDLVTESGDWKMTLPDAILFKDVTTDSFIPPVNERCVEGFLQPQLAAIDNTSKELYEARFIRFMRWCYRDGSFFISSQCWAEMKKTTVYCIFIELDMDGVIIGTQCECAAGMGPSATCKHVRALFFAILSFNTTGELKLEATCTEVLQTFHRPKKLHAGSPVKSSNLDIGLDVTKYIYDPTPEEYRETPAQINTRVKNLTISHASRNGHQPPMLQTIPPANILAVYHDHNYSVSTVPKFLADEKITKISEEERKDIEEKTRTQSLSKCWLNERRKRLHSSNYGTICKAKDETKSKIAKRMVTPQPTIRSDPILHGKKYEAAAIRQYELATGYTVKPSGIVVCKDRPYLGCSPDGLVNDDLVIEVKCPYSARGKMISPKTVQYVEEDIQGNMTLAKENQYMYQVQGLLHITGRNVCHFAIYTIKDFLYIPIVKDNKFIEEKMLPQLDSFYENNFTKEYLGYILFKNTSDYNFS